MPRNFFRRIETVFPIEDGNLRERIASEILAIPLADNTKARVLQPDGTYSAPSHRKTSPARRSQAEFIALALGEKTIRRAAPTKKPAYPEMKLRSKPVVAGRSKRS